AASSLNSALNVFLVVDLMCSPKVIYEVIISPLFRWPKLVCHYTFNIGVGFESLKVKIGLYSLLLAVFRFKLPMNLTQERQNF
ncbi:hypothetical protein ACRN91_18990, partial [Shewanella baltica]|uniref:hypothetical protein n=1 Tax=Shewanella baltica TaxID=62322 RepID=UPI003D79BDBB